MSRAANCDFFAVESDQRAVLAFLFGETDARVFESYSEFGAPLREFKSVEEVAGAFTLGTDAHGNGHAVLLQLWSPSVMSSLDIERVNLDPQHCDGHTYRHRIGGAGLIQLYFGGVKDKVITMSHLGHQSQTRASAWGVSGGVDWEALTKLSSKIRYHIARRLGKVKVPGRPVLEGALDLVKAGYAMKLAVQTPWAFELVAA